MGRKDLLALLAFGAAVAVAAIVGGLAAADSADQYGELVQPSWAPPSWLFGPVWTVLYIMVAVAGWGIWRSRGLGTDVGFWGAQMAFNALWTPFFFAWEMRGFALAWILVLDALVAALVIRTWRLRWPAWLLLPYLAWIVFATALNAAVWSLN